MKSQATADFWTLYRQLPERIQREAKKAYRLFMADPSHPSLRYHKVTSRKTGEELHSVSVTMHYRALAFEGHGDLIWFWIGHHSVYDAILAGR